MHISNACFGIIQFNIIQIPVMIKYPTVTHLNDTYLYI